jgi:ribosomal protein S17
MSVNMTSGCILTGVVVSNKTERTVAAEDVHLAKRAKTEIAETK